MASKSKPFFERTFTLKHIFRTCTKLSALLLRPFCIFLSSQSSPSIPLTIASQRLARLGFQFRPLDMSTQTRLFSKQTPLRPTFSRAYILSRQIKITLSACDAPHEPSAVRILALRKKRTTYTRHTSNAPFRYISSLKPSFYISLLLNTIRVVLSPSPQP